MNRTSVRVMRPARRKLGEMLVASGRLSETQLKGALERQKLVLQMRASGKMRFKAFRRGRSR